jgi:ribosomal protein S18 acetylase RimI-like enzyme
MREIPAFTIRPMRYTDLDQAISLSMAEGWNQTINDWKLLLENRHNVCIVAVKDRRVAGTATALNHENKIAWIGMVLVDKSLRGMGAGKLLLEDIIIRLRGIESVKLDATPAGEPLYSKLGFIPEYKVFRMRRDAGDYSSDKASPLHIQKIDHSIFKNLVRMDQTAFGADRSYLLTHLLSNYPDKTLCITSDNGIEGYLFGRDGSKFCYIGPVIARSQDIAESLISRALESHTDQPVAVDVPEHREKLIRWLEAAGFVIQRHFLRMYLNINPFPGDVKSQFLISGPEFG